MLSAKVIFSVLQEKIRPSFNAAYMCGIITDFDDSPLSIYEQKDVDEFFNLFLDRLEKCFSGPDATILLPQQCFGGGFANEIVCEECGRKTARREGFLSVSLQVKGKRRLEDSLDAFIESEALEGKNAYNCDGCKKPCKAKKRSLFQELPDTLVIVLKRFSYDTATM